MLDGKLRESLLETADITLDVCLQKARQKEIAQAQARSMQPPGASDASSSSSSVHRLHQTQKSFAGRGGRSSETAQPPTSLPRAAPQDRLPGGGKCYACGRRGHFAGNPNCPARGKKCSKCTKRGHFAAQCQSSPGKERSTKRGRVDDLSSSGVGQVQLPADTTPGAEYQLDSVAEVGHDPGEGAADPIFVGVHINDQELLMELDTGAKFSVIPEKIWKDKWPELSLSSCDVRLSTYDGTIVPILGEAFVSVNSSGKCIDLRAIVVKSGKYALFGRDWLHAFRPHWMNSIHLLHPSLKSVNVEPSEKNIEHAENLDAVRDFPEVFDERLGCISGCEATIHLQDGAVPKCIPARPVPYALRSKVDNELDRLEREGVIHKIEFAEWASPIVVVKKKNGDVRLCADFKVSINKYIDPQQHPIPSPTDLLSTLSGGQLFTKLDLRQAYTQLPLSSESQKYCVISTHRGLYAYTRLPFGVSSAPAVWQRVIEQIVAGIPGVICYFDDLLISGANRAEHDERLREVLRRFEKYGVRVGEEKCEFLKEEVKYLGYTVSNEGIQPDTEKVEAIVNAPAPESVQSLQSFLGMVNFYGRFIENLSSLLSPLYALLKKGCTWKWSADCQASFEEVKRKLADSPVLMHFDPQLPVVVEADASPYGIGACLSHVLPDESRRPVFFVSRALTSAERSYSQADKEGLAIVFGVRRLHQFVFGRHFIL